MVCWISSYAATKPEGIEEFLFNNNKNVLVCFTTTQQGKRKRSRLRNCVLPRYTRKEKTRRNFIGVAWIVRNDTGTRNKTYRTLTILTTTTIEEEQAN